MSEVLVGEAGQRGPSTQRQETIPADVMGEAGQRGPSTPGTEEKEGEGSLVSVLMFMCECSGVLCWCLILMFVDQ